MGSVEPKKWRMKNWQLGLRAQDLGFRTWGGWGSGFRGVGIDGFRIYFSGAGVPG